MATQAEYNFVASKLTSELAADEHSMVPAMFQGMIPADAAAKGGVHLAKLAVDALDAFRAQKH